MKKIALSLLFFLLASSLIGCWSKIELNELAVVTALAIDKKDDDYIITAQILNPGEIAGKAQSTRLSVSTYNSKGRSIFEAIRKLSTVTPRRAYFPHVQVVVFGESFAKEGIKHALDFLSRDHEFRSDFYIVVSKETSASQILNILTPVDKVPASKMYNTISVSEKVWAPTAGVYLDDLIGKLTAEGEMPVLTGIYVEGELDKGNSLSNVEQVPSPALIRLDHLAAFQEDKLAGWLNQTESKGFNYVIDNVSSTVGVLPCDGGNITFEVLNSKTDVTAKIKNNTPTITVKVDTEVTVAEVQCTVNVLNTEKTKKWEEELNKKLEEIILSSVSKAKELKTDIFGFGEVIHRINPKFWKDKKENWHNQGFLSLEVKIESKMKIRRTGTTGNPYQHQGSEG